MKTTQTLVAVHPAQSSESDQGFVKVETDDAVVTTAHRGAGVDKQLFAAAVTWIWACGLRLAHVQVWNAIAEAVEFYSKQGFSSIYTQVGLDLVDAQLGTKGGLDD